MLWIRARWLPSTSTLTVPSGSLSICRMFEMQPILYRSSAVGSSLAADFCATSRMLLPASMAISIALIDFGRPTKSGMTMCGNTTTSRSGSSGYWLGADAISFAMAFPGKRINSYIGAMRPPFKPRPVRDNSRPSSRARHLRRFGVDEKGLALADNGVLVHHYFAHILHRRKIEHEVKQHLFQDRTQAPGPGLSRQGFFGDCLQRLRAHFQIHSLHAEELLILLDESVLRLGQYLDQCLLVEFHERRHDRQPPYELRYEPVFDEVFRLDRAQDLADVPAVLQASHVRTEADAALFGAAADDLFQAVERSPANEQDVRGVHLHEVLVGMLAAALRRHGRDRPLDQLEQLLDDVLHVLADIARLGERGRVGDDARNVQEARHRLREQRLARSGGADKEDVRFGELDLVVLREVLQALVVVVYRDRKDLLGEFLPDHVLVQYPADFPGRRQVGFGGLAALVRGAFLADDVVAQLDALVADEHRRSGDQLPHLMLALAAKGAVEEFFAAGFFGHVVSAFKLPLPPPRPVKSTPCLPDHTSPPRPQIGNYLGPCRVKCDRRSGRYASP